MDLTLQDTLYVLVAICAAVIVLAFFMVVVGASIKNRMQTILHDEIRDVIQEIKRDTDKLHEKINTVMIELDNIRKRIG